MHLLPVGESIYQALTLQTRIDIQELLCFYSQSSFLRVPCRKASLKAHSLLLITQKDTNSNWDAFSALDSAPICNWVHWFQCMYLRFCSKTCWMPPKHHSLQLTKEHYSIHMPAVSLLWPIAGLLGALVFQKIFQEAVSVTIVSNEFLSNIFN